MDKALAHQAHTAERSNRSRPRRAATSGDRPAGIVHGKARAQAGERHALDPFHDNCRHTVDLAPAIEAGKALKARKGRDGIRIPRETPL